MNITKKDKCIEEDIVLNNLHENRLDALRGLAALLVALGHSVNAFSVNPLHSQTIFNLDFNNSHAVIIRLLNIVFNADSAVVIFFILSGHVLTQSLNKINSRNYVIELLGFLTKRAYRIFPVVIVSYLVSVYFVNNESVKLLKNMLLLDTSLNGVTWTLQVELVGSALVFLAFYIKREYKFGPILLALSILALFFSNLQPVYLTKYMIAFLLGSEISNLRQRLKTKMKNKLSIFVIFALIVMPSSNFIFGYKTDFSILVQIMCATVIVVFINSVSIFTFLERRFFRDLGKISYSFYLFHQTGGRFTRLLFNKVGMPLEKLPGLENVLAFALFSITIALIISALSYYFIEKPSVIAGSSVSKSIKTGLLKLKDDLTSHNYSKTDNAA